MPPPYQPLLRMPTAHERTWLLHIPRGSLIYLSKEREFARVAVPWAPDEPNAPDDRGLGVIALCRGDPGEVEVWFSRANGRGFDFSQILWPVEGHFTLMSLVTMTVHRAAGLTANHDIMPAGPEPMSIDPELIADIRRWAVSPLSAEDSRRLLLESLSEAEAAGCDCDDDEPPAVMEPAPRTGLAVQRYVSTPSDGPNLHYEMAQNADEDADESIRPLLLRLQAVIHPQVASDVVNFATQWPSDVQAAAREICRTFQRFLPAGGGGGDIAAHAQALHAAFAAALPYQTRGTPAPAGDRDAPTVTSVAAGLLVQALVNLPAPGSARRLLGPSRPPAAEETPPPPPPPPPAEPVRRFRRVVLQKRKQC